MKLHLFEDEEKVLLNGEVVTIKEWSIAFNLNRFAYTIEEYPSTFFFENELSKI